MAEPRLLSRAEIAEAFGAHRQTVTKWEQQGMPTAERGSRGRASRHALKAVVDWYVSRELAARGAGDGDRVDPPTERALLDRRRREAVEHALAVARGAYVRRVDIEHQWAGRVVRARDYLRGLPARFRTHLGLSLESAQAFGDLMDECLNELADDRAPEEEEPLVTNPGMATRRTRFLQAARRIPTRWRDRCPTVAEADAQSVAALIEEVLAPLAVRHVGEGDDAHETA